MKRHLQNENGTVMVIALLLMAILTILGISAINMSNVDLMIASNERQYKQNFYRAEAAANEAVQLLDDADADNLMLDDPAKFTWLNDDAIWPVVSGVETIEDPTQWTGTKFATATDNIGRYAVLSKGIAGGGSIDITAPSQLFEFEVHGQYYRAQGGWSQVVIGYRKRF